jgi:hypothetical protein
MAISGKSVGVPYGPLRPPPTGQHQLLMPTPPNADGSMDSWAPRGIRTRRDPAEPAHIQRASHYASTAGVWLDMLDLGEPAFLHLESGVQPVLNVNIVHYSINGTFADQKAGHVYVAAASIQMNWSHNWGNNIEVHFKVDGEFHDVHMLAPEAYAGTVNVARVYTAKADGPVVVQLYYAGFVGPDGGMGIVAQESTFDIVEMR